MRLSQNHCARDDAGRSTGIEPALLWLALLAMLFWVGTPLTADTIFQTNARGKTVVVHSEAIVVRQDDSSIEYKHFELRERRVVKIRLSRGAQTYTVKTSGPEDRRRIVEKWKRFAYTAAITDTAGKQTRLAGLYLDFYPPGGRGSLLESVPPRTALPVMIEGGSTDDIEFSKISGIEFQGERMTLMLTNGHVKQARFLMPTDQPAEARFLGMTDKYDPASPDVFNFGISLDKVKEVRFE